MFSSRKLDLLALLLVCFVAFWWRLGTLGFIDPDEPFYAQTAREMIASGDWLTPQIYGAPQFEKPILYYWLVAGSFKIFGETEWAGRAPTALFSTVLAVMVWAFGARVWNARAGFLAALVLATGLEFSIMSRLMLTDVPLATFLAGAIFSYWMAVQEPERREKWIFLHLVFAGLAVLTKGPIGSLVTVLAVVAFSFATKRAMLFRGRGFWSGAAAYAMIVVPWYALMFVHHARQFWEEFFIRDNWLRMWVAEHPANDHWWYYVGLLLLGSIPWMPAVALTVRRAWSALRADEAAFFQWCWLLTSLLFLTIARSKLPSYAVYLFVPLALLVGRSLDDVLERGFATAGERRLVVGFAVFQCAVVGLLFVLCIAGTNPAVVAIFSKAGSLVKTVRPFETPILLVFASLALSLVFLFRRNHTPWLLTTALASLALLAGALTAALPAVEAESSARPVAEALMNARKQGEPLISGKFLVRGIIYYTRSPVSVIAKKEQPFWAAHPLPVVLWKKGLRDFLNAHPTALCALRRSEWEALDEEDAFATRDAFSQTGENILIRARVPEKAKAPLPPGKVE